MPIDFYFDSLFLPHRSQSLWAYITYTTVRATGRWLLHTPLDWEMITPTMQYTNIHCIFYILEAILHLLAAVSNHLYPLKHVFNAWSTFH